MQRLLLSAPLLAGGLEIALRLSGYSFPQLARPDRDTGWSLRPGASGIVRSENKAGVFVRVNSDGLRDREHALAKPAHTTRIALLGDSLCEAAEVPLEKTFWSLLERKLQARSVEVINFGVAGYSTAQELIALRTKVWKYQPDIVLLAFTLSDIGENYRPLNGNALAPYFVFERGGLALDASFRSLIRHERLREANAALARSSRVVQLADDLFSRARLRKAPRPADREDVYAPPGSAGWREAWNITEELLRAMNGEVRAHGASFSIATLSNPIQVHPDAQLRRAVAARAGASDLFYPDRRIGDFARREGIPAAVLGPALAAYAERNRVFLHGFDQPGAGHWNEAGHRAAAELLYPFLLGLGASC